MTFVANKCFSSVGASAQVLQQLQLAVGELPGPYLELLFQSNGGEAPLHTSPFTLCLDSAESALSYWKSNTYTNFFPGVFVFGGDGGGSLLAFDMRSQRPWPIIYFDPIDPEGSIKVIASDFSSFLGFVGKPADE